MEQTTTAAEKLGQGELYALLEGAGIAWQHHDHPPLHTVEESQALRGDLPGGHAKNMFLKAKKGGLWLVTCLEHRQIRVRDLEKQIGAKGLSFGKPDLLWDALGVLPGAVTPFGLINDRAGAVTPVLDRQMLERDPLNFHPLHNEATTAIATADLHRFLDLTGHTPVVADFDALEAQAAARAAEG
ncbi:MAG: prolyl-tRNA synthetase associated domain-containing protein [Pseudomonadota bacterium]